ncbi:MAG: biotin/lipoyl-binding protein [Solirubrobacterales bacterium]|nr:biotin/lipoyl-binding protein [Solirubrobacterales bacterium]
MFGTVLVANRGEIAVRVIRTLRALGIRAVAVYSDADAAAPHVDLADEAIRLGPAAPSESYLAVDRVLRAARRSGADAIHPGYGFLSENPGFARACEEHGIVFVGPPPSAMELLGDKVAAKLAAEAVGVPLLPGLQRPGLSDDEILEWARDGEDRFPLMVKAAAGGGGRGMRIVRADRDLPDALAAARREAKAGFGDDGLLVERYVERARHVEVQLIADRHGTVLHLGERECSLQRRHQKVLEESPSPVISPVVRARLGEAAVALARHAGYVGAGTAEFLVPADDPAAFAFLEVNARLQVEHPVTEFVTGLDLVECQLRIAADERLPMTQDDVELRGHAVEVRVCAEDPMARFLPTIGRLTTYREPTGPGIRVDSGVALGSRVGPDYDSLLLKLIATGADRHEALERLWRALGDLRLLGLTTNAGYLARLVASSEVSAGEMDTGLLERGVVAAAPDAAQAREAAIATAATRSLTLGGPDPWEGLPGWRVTGDVPVTYELAPVGDGDTVVVEIAGDRVRVGEHEASLQVDTIDPGRVRIALDGRARVWDHASVDGELWVSAGSDAFAHRVVEPVVQDAAAVAGGEIDAPMPGSVLSINVAAGDRVAEGDLLLVVESMKMELALTAPADAEVTAVIVSVGDHVTRGQALVELDVAES